MNSPRRSVQEKIEVVKLFYKFGSYAEVARQWPSTFLSKPPSRQAMAAIVQRFEDTGSVADLPRCGRPKSATSGEHKAALKEAIQRSPHKSTSRASLALNISRTSVWRLLKELGLKPFRPRLIHALSDDDFDRRLEFCESFLEMVETGLINLDNVLWTDEATFKLNGHVNRHNCVYWSEENPNITISREVNAPGVCCWAGISSERIIGPFFFDTTVSKDSYLALPKDQIEPAIAGKDLFYMHDGAPAHYAKEVRAWLDEKFSDRWIGRRGPIEWPPRSSDLTPPDFFLWGVLKEQVYAERVGTIDELRHKIIAACAAVPVELCQKVCQSVNDRLFTCIEAGGAHTELF